MICVESTFKLHVQQHLRHVVDHENLEDRSLHREPGLPVAKIRPRRWTDKDPKGPSTQLRLLAPKAMAWLFESEP